MRSRFVRSLIVAVVCLGLLATSVAPADARLTEIVVAGTLIFQALEVVSVLVPQLATLGTSLVGLATAGKELIATGQRIVSAMFPGRAAGDKNGDKKRNPAPAGGAPAPLEFKVPVISGPTPARPRAEEPTGALPAERGDLASRVDELVGAYRTRGRASDGASGYGVIVSSMTAQLLEAIDSGDTDAVGRFLDRVRALEPADQPAVKPVLAEAVQKGSRFEALHAPAGGAARGPAEPATGVFRQMKHLAESFAPAH
jgi:hypothetical protein